jgi:3-oxoacyl-[acyl-carrier-protein] synthase III
VRPPLYLAGLSALSGADRMSVVDAVKLGEYADDEASLDGYLSVSVEPNLEPSEMALANAVKAMSESGVTANHIDAMFYGSIHRHGQPRFWSPASGLQNSLGISGQIPSIAMQQGCNSLTQALLLASSIISSEGAFGNALLVGADRFSGSGFNRWNSDYGLIYGDASAAMIVSRHQGFAKFLHIALDGVPALEELHRDAAPRAEGPDSWRSEYDVRRSKKAFLQRHGRESFTAPLNDALARLRKGLENNPSWDGDADWLLTPFVGNRIRLEVYEPAFQSLAKNTLLDYGRTLGHTGTVDAWIGLEHLRKMGALVPGVQVLIVTAGVGFSAGLLLLKII